MAEKRFSPGTFCWVELGTTDAKAAAGFYSRLLGWGVKEQEMPGGMGTYTLFQLAGKDIAGAYALTEEQISQGTPPNWLSYVMVKSADETASKAKALGATFFMEPTDVPGVGKLAILQDPTGATVALFEAGDHPGAAPLDNRPGTFCWNELATNDIKAARKFYEGVFSWTSSEMDMGPDGTYTMFMNGDRMAGGHDAYRLELGSRAATLGRLLRGLRLRFGGREGDAGRRRSPRSCEGHSGHRSLLDTPGSPGSLVRSHQASESAAELTRSSQFSVLGSQLPGTGS